MDYTLAGIKQHVRTRYNHSYVHGTEQPMFSVHWLSFTLGQMADKDEQAALQLAIEMNFSEVDFPETAAFSAVCIDDILDDAMDIYLVTQSGPVCFAPFIEGSECAHPLNV